MSSESAERGEYLTLTQAANVAPGRPTTNCLWRWCRKGVVSRSGHRVRLRHIRAGGKIFTKAEWVEEFGRTLAEADAEYFDLADAAVEAARAAEPPQPRRRRPRSDGQRREALSELDRQLQAEGL